jgi:hypothetical protein
MRVGGNKHYVCDAVLASNTLAQCFYLCLPERAAKIERDDRYSLAPIIENENSGIKRV